jgi:hypothetical protein
MAKPDFTLFVVQPLTIGEFDYPMHDDRPFPTNIARQFGACPMAI